MEDQAVSNQDVDGLLNNLHAKLKFWQENRTTFTFDPVKFITE